MDVQDRAVGAVLGVEAIHGARDLLVRVGGCEGEIHVHAGLGQGGCRYVVPREVSIN